MRADVKLASALLPNLLQVYEYFHATVGTRVSMFCSGIAGLFFVLTGA